MNAHVRRLPTKKRTTMKNLLLPHKFGWIGWIILIPSAILGFDMLFSLLPDWNGISTTGMVLNNIAIIGVTTGFIFVGFAKKKDEDEYSMALRLDSLLKAVYLSYGLLIATSLIWYKLKFVVVMFMLLFCVLALYLIFLGIGNLYGRQIRRAPLFPHCWRRIGWCIYIPAIIFGLYMLGATFLGPPIPLWDNVAIISLAISTLLVSFSREAEEDEYITHLRMNTLLKSVYIHYSLVIIFSLISYNMTFIKTMFILFYTLPLIHHILFRREIRRMNRT